MTTSLAQQALQTQLKAHRLRKALTLFDAHQKYDLDIARALQVEAGDPVMSNVRRYCAALGLLHTYEVDSI